ncbi:MAG: hypothetical protein ACREOW_00475 [Thermodesulfobacteriota bacterium]
MADNSWSDEEKLLSVVVRLNAKMLGLILGILLGPVIFIATNRLVIKGSQIAPGGNLIIEFKSPFYGLFLALLKYSRRLRVIPRKCFIPGQSRRLFRGYRKGGAVGVGVPLFYELARIFGNNIMIKISLALGRIPLLRLFYYSLIFELYNDRRSLKG